MHANSQYTYFNFSTCFGQLCALHQENLLYLCDTGILHSVWVASLELLRLISPIIFSKNTYLVYVLQIPLLQSTVYQLYKLQPSPIRQQDNVLVYVEPKRDFIFVDAMRNKYGKMNYQELQACIMPNKFNYVCQETLPIFTYIPNDDCEATLIHPSTSYFPNKVCGLGLLKLEYTYWILLHMSNEWLYVTPKTEVFTVLCGSA